MATRFIAYVPKPTKEKHVSKSPCKSTPEDFSTSDSNQPINRNPVPVRISAMENDFLVQEVNRNNGVMVQESLTGICKSSNNSDEDEDDTYFPTVQELIAGRGLSRGHAPKAVDKPALDNPDESISGPNSRNSQDVPVLVEGNEQNDTGSEADLSDFHLESTRSTESRSESRQTSLDTTISSSKPQNSEANGKVSRAAELWERVRGSLKRKTRSIRGEGLGDLSDSSSDNGSETESEFDDKLAQKKQKTDNSRHSRKERPTSNIQTARTMQDELLAADTESEYTKGCQDPLDGQDPYDGAIKLLGAICGSELENNNTMDGSPQEDIKIMSALQPSTAAVISQESVIAIDGQSAPLTRGTSTRSTLDDPEMSEQAVEVVNGKQEWVICDITGKEDVDGVPHYWVQWSARLVPKCEMRKATALIARFEARLRAQRKQKGGKGQSSPFPSRADKQAVTRATGETQQKKGRCRPRKQV